MPAVGDPTLRAKKESGKNHSLVDMDLSNFIQVSVANMFVQPAK